MKKWFPSLILGLALGAAAHAAPSVTAPSVRVPYEMFRLKNGLTVIVHEDHSAPIVSINVWYHVGSGREIPGRTGFAHLFEHIMFNGSKNVPVGAFDQWLEAVGGNNNGSTSTDRTNYWINIPASAIETALFVESDRMAYLLDTMSPARVDQQRDVVKNERRQGVENAPYGLAPIMISEALYPKDHPYSWPVIGSMADLSAASHEDVKNFFKKWYGPANASLAIAGDITVAEAKRLTEKWFAEVPASVPVEPQAARGVILSGEKRLVLEDNIELPRLYFCWPAPAAYTGPSVALEALADLFAGGKNSRLYKRLVYELQVAQEVDAFVDSGILASTFNVVVTVRAGQDLDQVLSVVDEEIAKLSAAAPSEKETQRVKNQMESEFFSRLERIGGFGGKADMLNEYYFYTRNPGFFESNLALIRAVSPQDLMTLNTVFLREPRILLSAVPKGKKELALAEVKP